MTRYFKTTISLALLLAVVSCTKKDKDGFTKTESGLWYKFINSSNGAKPEAGDIMQMEIIYLTASDSVLFDSKSKSDAFTVVKVEPTFVGGVEEGFAMMSAGDSAHFKASADSIFEKTFHTTLPSYMKPGSLITFRVKLQNITSKSVHDSIKQAQDLEKRKAEFQQIELFLKQNNMDVMPTENGAYMVTSKQGTGDFPAKGDTVMVTYTGRMLNGTVFDQSVDKKKPFRFVLGTNMVIQGWEECMPFLNKGAVAKLLIPSDLGYGADDYGTLPGYSTLFFDVEIMDIKRGIKKDQPVQ